MTGQGMTELVTDVVDEADVDSLATRTLAAMLSAGPGAEALIANIVREAYGVGFNDAISGQGSALVGLGPRA